MKKILIGVSAISLALLACSDDSSSNSNGNHALTGSNRVDLQMASKCLDNGLGVLYKKAGSDELDKAYLVEDSTGNNQILVPELNDYCDIMADFKSKRLGGNLVQSGRCRRDKLHVHQGSPVQY